MVATKTLTNLANLALLANGSLTNSQLFPRIRNGGLNGGALPFPSFTSKIREGVKNEHFTVRLTVSVYHPPITVSFLWNFFLCVLLTWYYDYVCSETDFTQEKVNFHVTTGLPNSSSYCCSSHSGHWAGMHASPRPQKKRWPGPENFQDCCAPPRPPWYCPDLTLALPCP